MMYEKKSGVAEKNVRLVQAIYEDIQYLYVCMNVDNR